jgi:hypothetical protein
MPSAPRSRRARRRPTLPARRRPSGMKSPRYESSCGRSRSGWRRSGRSERAGRFRPAPIRGVRSGD